MSTPSDRADHALIERCRQGDHEAWAVLIGRYEKELRDWIARRWRRPNGDADVKDVSQQLWMSLLEHERKRLGDYDSKKGSFFVFLLLRAHDIMADMQRQKERRHELPVAQAPVDPEDRHDSEAQLRASMDDFRRGLSCREGVRMAERVAEMTAADWSQPPRSAASDRKADQRLKERIHAYFCPD